MVIVKIYGGLGNELFQYALYRKLQSLGKEVFCDIQMLEPIRQKNWPTIDIFPNINIPVAGEENRKKFGDVSRSIPARFRRKLRRKKSHVYEERKPKHFQPEVFEMNQVYLEGYWQSERYFSDIREQLLKDFSFPSVTDRRNQELVSKMEKEISVSVHIRRGDYLEGKNREIYGGVCTDTYYHNAVSYFKKKYPDAHFYFFSNDPAWVTGRYQGIDMTVVDWNQGINSYWDMYLMSKCNHNIIANSSFSWWGGWLNCYKNKEVIAPMFWFNPQYNTAEDIVCREWIKIKG